MSLDPALQLALRERPSGSPVMRQRWRELLFLHFACEPGEIAALLPPGLSVDTFPDGQGRERAWVGLVPFVMRDVRLASLPRFPGTHTFPETNVRTYVHHEGRNPGVWFFSLDAANLLAVAVARLAFALPYFHARMSIERNQDRLTYAGRRAAESYRIEATLGPKARDPQPGTLDFFLVERYLLYAHRRGRLLSGLVHHSPYALRETKIERVDETLVRAAGIATRTFTHRVFSEGVDVDVFPLKAID